MITIKQTLKDQKVFVVVVFYDFCIGKKLPTAPTANNYYCCYYHTFNLNFIYLHVTLMYISWQISLNYRTIKYYLIIIIIQKEKKSVSVSCLFSLAIRQKGKRAGERK